MKFSRLRTFLLTCCFGIAAVSTYARINSYLNSPPVVVPSVLEIPQVESETPIIIRVCPAYLVPVKANNQQRSDGYVADEDKINCVPGGGGGSGGNIPISKGQLLGNNNPPLIPAKFKHKK